MAAAKQPFPTTFKVAIGIELFERLAFYGMYIGLSLYLTNVVGFDDIASGIVLGNYRLVGTVAPIPCGAISDRIGFRRSLLIAFVMYAASYLGMFLFPAKSLTVASLMLM